MKRTPACKDSSRSWRLLMMRYLKKKQNLQRKSKNRPLLHSSMRNSWRRWRTSTSSRTKKRRQTLTKYLRATPLCKPIRRSCSRTSNSCKARSLNCKARPLNSRSKSSRWQANMQNKAKHRAICNQSFKNKCNGCKKKSWSSKKILTMLKKKQSKYSSNTMRNALKIQNCKNSSPTLRRATYLKPPI